MDELVASKDTQEGKFFAVISYISFLCIISLILKKDNKFSLHHAKQGLVLFVFEVVCFIFSVIPFPLLVKWLIFLFFVFVSLLGILQAFRGVSKNIPVISDMAEKIIL